MEGKRRVVEEEEEEEEGGHHTVQVDSQRSCQHPRDVFKQATSSNVCQRLDLPAPAVG